MKIRRIRLKSYRGVAERTIEFPETGVTVVVGPNEIGKSSLSEALDLLFDQLDSSKRQSVRAVQPVHRDEGTEIEADVTCGPYAFTYRKRFHKKPETHLTITQPVPENLTGREAHERVLAILGETVDVPLWRALRIQQGEELAQPDLGSGATLSAALDRAAGQTQADDDAESLFDSASAEYERYFTARGKPKKDANELAAAVSATEAELAEIEDALRRVEQDVRQSEEIVRRAAEVSGQLAQLEEHAVAAEARWTSVQGESERVQQLGLAADLAAARASESAQRAQERAELVARESEVRARLGELRARQEQESGPLAAAEARLSESLVELETARTAATTARELAELRDRDREFRRAELDHVQLSERLARVRAADEAARVAEELLSRSRADEAGIAAVREASLELERARARLDAGAAHVRVDALRDVSIATGEDDPRALSAGDVVEKSVSGELQITIGDAARLTVTPSRGAQDLIDALAAAGTELSTALVRVGADDVAAAEAAHVARGEAERAVVDRQRVRANDLRDLTSEELERKAETTARFAAHYLAERVEEPPPADDFDTAKVAAKTDLEARRATDDVAERARDTHAVLEQRIRTLREEHVESTARLTVTAAELAREAAALETAREIADDETLAEQQDQTVAAGATARETHGLAASALARSEPTLVESAASGARAAVTSARGELRDLDRRQIEIGARLEELGQRGLAERAGETGSLLERHRASLAGRTRRAAAAERLFTALRTRRDDARRAYVAPLAARVDQLGRFVFGADFAVTLDDDLRVVSRTLGGRTVPFDDLSGGAREQLSLLLRLAAAQVVAADGGVPLILDDALGYSDPGRLAAMGAVLDRAGESTQVIVLTCLPERYRHVSRRTEIRLEADVD